MLNRKIDIRWNWNEYSETFDRVCIDTMLLFLFASIVNCMLPIVTLSSHAVITAPSSHCIKNNSLSLFDFKLSNQRSTETRNDMVYCKEPKVRLYEPLINATHLRVDFDIECLTNNNKTIEFTECITLVSTTKQKIELYHPLEERQFVVARLFDPDLVETNEYTCTGHVSHQQSIDIQFNTNNSYSPNCSQRLHESTTGIPTLPTTSLTTIIALTSAYSISATNSEAVSSASTTAITSTRSTTTGVGVSASTDTLVSDPATTSFDPFDNRNDAFFGILISLLAVIIIVLFSFGIYWFRKKKSHSQRLRSLKQQLVNVRTSPVESRLTRLGPISKTRKNKSQITENLNEVPESYSTEPREEPKLLKGHDNPVKSVTVGSSRKVSQSIAVDLGSDTSTIKSIGKLFVQATDIRNHPPMLVLPKQEVDHSSKIINKTIESDTPPGTAAKMNSKAEDWDSVKEHKPEDLAIQIMKRIARHKRIPTKN